MLILFSCSIRVFFFFFFFSSRRRHTRCSRDWSSDVCSSDLSAGLRLGLYQGAYGWTELRFFVAASIAWLAACLCSAIALLLVDRMRWLPHALAMSAVGVTLAVSAIGPQAFVIHENVARVLDPSLVAPGGAAGLDI